MHFRHSRNKIRVAMIIQSYHPRVGGAERQLAALAPLLQAQGVDVHILTRRYAGLKSFEVIDGIPVHRLPIPGSRPVASLSFSLSAQPLLYRLKPNLVHAHELLSPTTTAVISKRLFGVPVVAKVLRGGQLGDIAELKRHSTGPRRLAIMRRYVDGFITISQEIDRELAALGVPQEKRPFIPNGVDTARFAPVDTQQREVVRRELSLPDGPIAVFTGRLSKEKQIDQLINVWPQVRAVHPQASLLLLGTGDQEAALKRSAGAGVVFGGVVSNVVPYLQGADLFVLPSATEGLSNALLEAMATGLPVVASNVGGAPDLIKHGYNGRLISPESPTDIVESIIALFDDQAQRTQLGRQARQKVQRDYALPSIVNKLCDLYEHLLSV